MKLASFTSGKTGSITVSDVVFGATPNQKLIAQTVRVYRANERQGTSAVKTRSEVNRTKKKWFKQKGTGNARHGSRNAPIFVGGGVAHGPKANQNWSLKLTKQMKKVAMCSILSAQAAQMTVVDQINDLSGKTKDGAELITQLKLDNKRVLVVLDQMSESVVRSLRNLDSVLLVTANQVSALEVAYANAILITSNAIKALEERLTGGPKAKKAKVVAEAKEEAKPKAKPAAKKPAAKPAVKKPAVKKAAPKKAAPKKTTKKTA